MTGFGRADGTPGPRLPVGTALGERQGARCALAPAAGLDGLEPQVRVQDAKGAQARQHAGVAADWREAAARIKINETVLEEVLQLASTLRRRSLPRRSWRRGVLQVRGILEMTEPEADEATEGERQAALVTSFETALGRLIEARREEGAGSPASLPRSSADRGAERRGCRQPARSPEAIRARLAEQVERLTSPRRR